MGVRIIIHIENDAILVAPVYSGEERIGRPLQKPAGYSNQHTPRLVKATAGTGKRVSGTRAIEACLQNKHPETGPACRSREDP